MINESLLILLFLLSIPLLGLISLPYLVERTAKLDLIPIEATTAERYQHSRRQ